MRRLFWLLTFSLLLIPALSLAIRLGDIKLFSALYQPLHAEVEILDLHDISAKDIQVSLASTEDFNRLSLERFPLLTKLKFQVTKGKEGQSVISVTTREAVNEPYLNFLLDLRWPNGHFFHQYTILLDPPGYSKQSSVDETQAQVSPKTVTEPTIPAPQPLPAVAAQPVVETHIPVPVPVSQVPPAEKSYGPVNHAEPLWKVVKKVKTDHSVTNEQVMVAVLGLNPSAFIDNNINRLKTGVTLSLPSFALMQAIPQNMAMQQVQLQNKAWQDYRHGVKKSAYSPLNPKIKQLLAGETNAALVSHHAPSSTISDTSNPAPNATHPLVANNNQEPEQLNLLPVQSSVAEVMPPYAPGVLQHKNQEALPVLSPRANGPETPSELPPPLKLQSSAETGLEQNAITQSVVSTIPQEVSHKGVAIDKNLRTELAIAAQALNTAKQANQMLQLRLQQLEQQNQELQTQKKANRVAASSSSATAAQVKNTTTKNTRPVIKQLPTAGVAFANHETSSTNWLNWLIVTLILLAIISSLGWIWQRGWLHQFSFNDFFKKYLSQDVSPVKDSKTPSIEPFVREKIVAHVQGDISETVDPFEQAGVYITYKRYDQAESVLLMALEQKPDDVRLWLRLFELYVSTHNRASYETAIKKVPESLISKNSAIKHRMEELAQAEEWAGAVSAAQQAPTSDSSSIPEEPKTSEQESENSMVNLDMPAKTTVTEAATVSQPQQTPISLTPQEKTTESPPQPTEENKQPESQHELIEFEHGLGKNLNVQKPSVNLSEKEERKDEEPKDKEDWLKQQQNKS